MTKITRVTNRGVSAENKLGAVQHGKRARDRNMEGRQKGTLVTHIYWGGKPNPNCDFSSPTPHYPS